MADSSRRNFLRSGLLAGVATAVAPSSKEQVVQRQSVLSMWSGAITANSAQVKARMENDGSVRLAVSTNSSMSSPQFSNSSNASLSENFRMATLNIEGLQRDTIYYYAIEYDGAINTSVVGKFKTFPAGSGSFKFICSSCAQPNSNNNVFDVIRNREPLFFLHMGDLHYKNIGFNDLNEFRGGFTSVFDQDKQASLYRNIPIVYMWDDHDYGPNDSDSTAPGREASRLVYQEMAPHYPLPAGSGNVPIYHSFSVGRVRFIVSDLRSERDPVPKADDANKTMMGAAQKAWFKNELLDAKNIYKAPVIFWVSTMPYLTSSGADDWSHYQTERTELANFIRDNNITGIHILSGDAHMLAQDNGQNSDYASGGGAPIPVFQASPLNSPGSIKGGPYTNPPVPYDNNLAQGQFGQIEIDDDGGSQVDVRLIGYRENEEKMRMEFSYATTPTPIEEEELPQLKPSLTGSFPNPFNAHCTVEFKTESYGHVSIELFDIRGRRVRTLINGPVDRGAHSTRFEGSALSSGSYTIRLQTAEHTVTRQITKS